MKTTLENTSLFEVSWEVCNKVGGIYQVVSSKVLQAIQSFGDNYYLLGPDTGSNTQFEETDESCWDTLRYATTQINLPCRFGRWAIPGNPKVILVSYKNRYDSGQLLHNLWSRYGVDSLLGGWDYTEPVLFSTACGEMIKACYQDLVQSDDGRVIAHFHEWMCGAGLLYLKQYLPQAGTVFTTHATVLGRSMAGSGFDIYKQMQQINPAQEASAYNINAKYSLEKISAREADCFTAVSSITSDEAGYLLNKHADIVTPNGLDLDIIPDYSQNRETPDTSKKEVFAAAGRLLRREVPLTTRIFLISGRYEFHNKGIDAFLEALAIINNSLKNSNTKILAICAAMGGHSGVNLDAVSGDPDKKPFDGEHWITSHYVYNPAEDPILRACQRLNLTNAPENPVQVIFIPALLDGKDGFLNMPYYDVLSACELGVFPSWYEPWGYTPQESASLAVPTVTTDLSGFGNWVRGLQLEDSKKVGISIIPRRQTGFQETVNAIKDVMLQYASEDEAFISKTRSSVREIAEHCSWRQFFPHYLDAYTRAAEKARLRYEDPSTPTAAQSTLDYHEITTAQSTMPRLRSFKAITKLPENLNRLWELANNLWWYWHEQSWKLFEDMNRDVWHQSNYNPVSTIKNTQQSKLNALANDTRYCKRYAEIMEDFDSYMAEKPKTFDAISKRYPIAYFSMEYGLTECLPIYSGGLGVLSGDHLKSASDLNLPLVGIGLLYMYGYFKQTIDKEMRQVATYPRNNFLELPIERVLDANGTPLLITIDGLSKGTLYAQIWQVKVGRISLYLMDTDIHQNSPECRNITSRLYESNRESRFKQEVLLGIGGIRMLQALGIAPSVYHMNEGHSAFLVLERIRVLMLTHQISFAEAAEFVRATTIFTTHTPVEAGNETFSIDIIEPFFRPFAEKLTLQWNELLKFGKPDDSERNLFEMTLLALEFSYKANGVSAMHQLVSKNMWHRKWKEISVSEVPIGHVTNGIHVPTYTSPVMKLLLDRYIGEEWDTIPASSESWDKVNDIPDSELWAVKQLLKERLIEQIRLTLPDFYKKFDLSAKQQIQMKSGLTSDALVVGFGRRFAPYKRATLLFADPERLHSIISDSARPVIFIFSGKAHPADIQGQEILQQVIQYTLDPRFIGRVFFIENYSLRISKVMVSGCDVWLNTPRRPYEASGTSGQKVPVNGGVNLSVSDGWWCEGYNGQNGWTIGPVFKGDVLPVAQQHDYDDAEALYTLLETEVLPLYFERDAASRPSAWIAKVKNSLRTLASKYSSNRMVAEYINKYYTPAANRGKRIFSNNLQLARQLARWKMDMPSQFAEVQIKKLNVTGILEDSISCSNPITITVAIAPGKLTIDDLQVEFVLGLGDENGFTDSPQAIQLAGVQTDPETLTFSGSICPLNGGSYAYGVRVMPITKELGSIFETHLVHWA